MRVLHVISSIDRKAGGPLVAVAGLAMAQRKAGLDVGVLATYRAGDDQSVSGTLRAAGVDTELVGPCRSALMRCADLKPRVVQAVGGADVVHIHALWEEVQHQAARAAMRAGIPYLITPHGMLDSWALRQSRLKKAIYMAWRLRKNLQNAAMLHCTSRVEADQVAALRLGPPVLVEPFGLDLSEFNNLPPRGRFIAGYPQLGNRQVVVFLGRVHPGKGLEYLIPALRAPGLATAALAVVGPDSRNYTQAMQGLVRSCGVEDRVVFTGMLSGDQRLAALVDGDILALPSDHENFGMAVVEALAAGTPVLISDQVNIHREIELGGVGLICRNSVESVAQSLEHYFAQLQLRQEMRRRSHDFAASTYDWDPIARRWVGHYQNISGRSAGDRQDLPRPVLDNASI